MNRIHFGESGPLDETLKSFGVPDHLHEGLIQYVAHGRPTGSFLMAALQNNFSQACYWADEASAEGLVPLARWLYSEAPALCWGSPGKVAAWMERKQAERKSA